MPHLVRDIEGFEKALAAHRPFYWSVCGEVPPAEELTANPAGVNCPTCIGLIQGEFEKHLEETGQEGSSQTQMPDEPGVDDNPYEPSGLVLGDEDLVEDLDESPPLEMPSLATESLEVEDDGSNGKSHEEGPFSALQSMFSTIVGSSPEVDPDWRRWLVDPSTDPDGVLPVRGSRSKRDVRDMLSPEDRDRMVRLTNVASMAGAETLVAWLCSIIHGFATDALKAELALATAKKRNTAPKKKAPTKKSAPEA